MMHCSKFTEPYCHCRKLNSYVISVALGSRARDILLSLNLVFVTGIAKFDNLHLPRTKKVMCKLRCDIFLFCLDC